MDNIRIGYGYDIHPLVPAKEGLWLGGVHIPYHKKVQAHSDGDVLLHSICDALLGAAALGDIGKHFSDSDERWRDKASTLFINHTVHLIRKNGFRIINLDTTILLQEPHLEKYKTSIVDNLMGMLQLETINVKATRGEGLDAVGKGEAIAAHAICLLQKGTN